jgi:hypothetical protein
VAPSLRPTPKACAVSATDLRSLEPIHELLSELNDPFASWNRLASLVSAIPVLAARCVRLARSRLPPESEVESVERALLLIGNRGLETELFGVLEDLTVLKADLEDARARRQARKR